MSGLVVPCPYCGFDLKIMPQRKKKCSNCSRSIYVKSTPGDRTKRLMTETNAVHVEKLWAEHQERQQTLTTLRFVGLDERRLVQERERGAKSDKEAVVSILVSVAASTDSLHTKQMAFHLLANATSSDNQLSLEYRVSAIKCELLRFRQSGVANVEVSSPGPWPPAARMIQLHAGGVEIDAIARLTGYSVPTVERNLVTREVDARMGSQCEKYAGITFSVERAMKEMPLPCAQNCVCTWSPIIRSDSEI